MRIPQSRAESPTTSRITEDMGVAIDPIRGDFADFRDHSVSCRAATGVRVGNFCAAIRSKRDALASCPTSTRSSAERAGAAARQNSAKLLLPVASFASPNAQGPSQDPSWPTDWIIAIPPAAAVPVRIEVGIGQKVSAMDCWPISATIRATVIMTGWPGPTTMQTAIPSEQSKQANAQCQTRSPLLSECQPQSSMANSANRNGTALTTPTRLGRTPNSFTIIGMNKMRPYWEIF